MTSAIVALLLLAAAAALATTPPPASRRLAHASAPRHPPRGVPAPAAPLVGAPTGAVDLGPHAAASGAPSHVPVRGRAPAVPRRAPGDRGSQRFRGRGGLVRGVSGGASREEAVPPGAVGRTGGQRVRGTWPAAVAAGLGTAVLVGGVAGLVAGIVAAVACRHVLSRLEPRAVRSARRRTAADLPAAADLLAACLLAGAPMIDAAEAVADALDGPLTGPLRQVAAAIRLGADPADAWRALEARPELAPMARAVARTMVGGAPLADALIHLADERRRALRAEASAAARRVGVRAAAPLGLCFLPAFIFLGVAPVIASIATTITLP